MKEGWKVWREVEEKKEISKDAGKNECVMCQGAEVHKKRGRKRSAMSEMKLDVTVKLQEKNQGKGKHEVMEEEGSQVWLWHILDVLLNDSGSHIQLRVSFVQRQNYVQFLAVRYFPTN